MAAPLTASWTNTIGGGGDPGFLQFMQALALQGFSQFVNSQDLSGLPAGEVVRNPDGSINYSQTDLGGTGHNLASYYQELGEGAQGQRLYDLYKQGLTAGQVQSAYDPANNVQMAVQQLNQGAAMTPQWQKYVDSGLLQQQSQTDESGNTRSVWTLKPGSNALVNQPLFNHQFQTGANEAAFGFDPTRGFLTSASNVHGAQGFGGDKLSEFLYTALPMLIMAPAISAIGAGAFVNAARTGGGLAMGSGASSSASIQQPNPLLSALGMETPTTGTDGATPNSLQQLLSLLGLTTGSGTTAPATGNLDQVMQMIHSKGL